MFGDDPNNNWRAVIWRIDHNGAKELDFSDLGAGSSPRQFVWFEGDFYFLGGRDPNHGIWRIDSNDDLHFVRSSPDLFKMQTLYAHGGDLIITTRYTKSTPDIINQWRWTPGQEAELISEDNNPYDYFSLDGLLYYRSNPEGLYEYDGVAEPRLVAETRLFGTGRVYDGQIFYTDFHAIMAYAPATGLREVFRGSGDHPQLRIIDEFQDALLVSAHDGLYRVDGVHEDRRLSRRGDAPYPRNAGTTYRGRVHSGVTADRKEEVWAFDGKSSKKVSAAPPGFGCAERDVPD